MKKLLVIVLTATLGMSFTGCGLFEFSYANPVSGGKIDKHDDDEDEHEHRRHKDAEDEIEKAFNEIEDEEDLEKLFKEAEKKLRDEDEEQYDEDVNEDSDEDEFKKSQYEDSIDFLSMNALSWDVTCDDYKVYSAESKNCEVKDTYVATSMHDENNHLVLLQENTPGYDCIMLEVYDYGTVDNMEEVLDKAMEKFNGNCKEVPFYFVDHSQDDSIAVQFIDGDKIIYFVLDTPVVITESWVVPENSKGQTGDVLMAEDCMFNSIHVK